MKIDIKNIPVKKIIAIGACILAGISAVVEEFGNQKKDKTINDLLDRVSKLEEKD